MFNVKKEDLRRKARLVAGDHVLDMLYLEYYLSVIQPIKVRILLIISTRNKLRVISRDADNVFCYASTKEKVCTITSKEFTEC